MSKLSCLLVWLITCSMAYGAGVDALLKKPDAWYSSSEGQKAVSNILSWQSSRGDWPKNRATSKTPFKGQPKDIAGTFDNGATVGELRVIAKAYKIRKSKVLKEAFTKGIDHILAAQYSNGGWPQYFPLSKKYHRHITFNDGTMIRIIEFLQDVSQKDEFDFVDAARRTAAAGAVERGVQCILDCQIKVHGELTVWCAQHDEVTLAPAMARSYEHPSLSGAESAGILLFLMRLPNPGPAIVRSIEAGTAWYEKSKIVGYRFERDGDEPGLRKDASAPPIWARFYELETNRPIFSDRDGVVKYDISEIGKERRSGYAWFGNSREKVAKEYSRWRDRTKLRSE